MEDVGGMVNRSVCIDIPPNVNSCGILGDQGTDGLNGIFKYSTPRLLLFMSLVLVTSHLIHRFLKRLLLPALLSQVIVGLIIGQLFKGHLSDETGSQMVEGDIKIISSLTYFGYVFFLFLNGVKVDPTIVVRDGMRALWIGLASVTIPVVLDILVLKSIGLSNGNIITNKTFPLAVTYAMTSFPVTHCLLGDMKFLNSELGRLGMSAAIVSHMFSEFLAMISYFMLLVITATNETSSELAWRITRDLVCILAFVVGVLVALRCAFKWLLRKTTPDGAMVNDEFVYLTVVLFLLSPMLATSLNTLILVGPLLFGLAVPEGPQVGSMLLDKFDSFISGVILPLFVALCAARTNLQVLFQNPADEFMTTTALSAILIQLLKFVVIIILPLFCNVPLKDAVVLSFILCTKGIVELADYSFMKENQLIPQNVYALNIILVVLIAITAPIILKVLYDPSRKYVGYAKRSIMHSNVYDELRMLVCIHVPSNVISTINLLDNFYPNRASGMSVNVVHLVKQCSKALPVFITHQKQGTKVPAATATASESVYHSGNLLTSFERFESENEVMNNIHTFTVGSPSDLIHEDICNLAFDKLTSFIILPFHRRRLMDGTIELDDSLIRNINCTVLERSPCSVGIFIEGQRHLKRSNLKGSSPGNGLKYQVGVIFIGGNDDREALTLATRISQDMRVQLTVIHLKAAYRFDSVLQKYEEMYDDEALRIAKEHLNVSCVEKEVNEGSETASFLLPLVHKFDLAIVGRRYNKVEDARKIGLEEKRTEFPELGVVGDLLASKDFRGEYSVLVVQQQRTEHKKIKQIKLGT